MLQEGDVAVIRSGDEYHPYYLLKLNCNPFETTGTMDDYRQEFPSNHRVIQGHYLECFREVKEGDIYFVEMKYTAIISSLCVNGVCPDFVTTMKRKVMEETMFLVDSDLHQALCELSREE